MIVAEEGIELSIQTEAVNVPKFVRYGDSEYLPSVEEGRREVSLESGKSSRALTMACYIQSTRHSEIYVINILALEPWLILVTYPL